MTKSFSKACTAFDGSRLLSAGPLIEVALAVKNASEAGAAGPILVFDDMTGQVVDLDLRGAKADLVARLSRRSKEVGGGEPAAEPRGRGRPKLGVIGREVTLLPRHWEWLARQPGGASIALRKLVDEARRTGADKEQTRLAREAAYRFMSAMAGDLPGFEEATRALFADDPAKFARESADWPEAVRVYASRLAFGDPQAQMATEWT
jgi:uncharacterized protein